MWNHTCLVENMHALKLAPQCWCVNV
jgi:hypothetical protein